MRLASGTVEKGKHMGLHVKSVITLMIASAVTLAGCGGGSRSQEPGTAEPPPPPVASNQGCDGSCTTADSLLSVAQVQQVIAQAAAEASAQGAPAHIAVVDRVGNVLGVFRMNGAPSTTTIQSGKGDIGGLEMVDVIPSELSAVAKAVTGAFLSSEGNAFSTRTASQIVQENFNPGEVGQPSGPLFGVQFSQLPCSDLNRRFGVHGDVGPKRSPLGLSADPGGLPLYIDGAVVGGIGIEADGEYRFDPLISDIDRDVDEIIATAGAFGYAAPNDRRGDRITADGKTFRFSDASASDLATDPTGAAGFGTISGGVMGEVIAVPGYADAVIRAGTAFGQPASGYRLDDEFYPGLDAFVLVDENNNNRYPPMAGTDGENALTATEVQTLVQQAIMVANRARAQIRRPLGTPMRVTVSVVDTNGVVLAMARTRDGPVFGTDVSLQKARTASFYSGAYAGNDLRSAPDANYLNGQVINFEQDYVMPLKAFLDSSTALDDGAFAFADRSGGNLSRPFYPDGAANTANGPFSKPFDQWSIFSDGIQLDLVYNTVISHVLFYLGAIGAIPADAAPSQDVPMNCTNIGRLPNGIQIFPGSVPIYKGSALVGGIGVSGDGVDQDDMVSFLGLHNAGEVLGTINNAPPAMRADQLTPKGVRLRYVQCPQSPFIDSDEQNVCEGK
jgi:uncharacterized protein GlcG (DUF336 family)